MTPLTEIEIRNKCDLIFHWMKYHQSGKPEMKITLTTFITCSGILGEIQDNLATILITEYLDKIEEYERNEREKDENAG